MIPARSRKGGRKIRGDLESLSLAEILQTLQLGMKTARLTLTSDEGKGRIWIENGAIKNAAIGKVTGEAALFRLLSWRRGQFVIDPGCRTESVTIQENTEYLLLEGMRRLDETEAREKREAAAGCKQAEPAVSPSLPALLIPLPASRGRLLADSAGLILVILLAGVLLWPDSAPSAIGPGSLTAAAGNITPPSLPSDGPMENGAGTLRKTVVPSTIDPGSLPAINDFQPIDPLAEAASRMVVTRKIPPPAFTRPVMKLSFPPPLLYSPEIEFATIEFVGKSHVKEGSLTLLVDGEEIRSLALSGKGGKAKRLFGRLFGKSGMQFAESRTLPPGSHRITARLEIPEKGAVFEKTLDIDLESFATGRVRVVLGKSFGRRIGLKIESNGYTD